MIELRDYQFNGVSAGVDHNLLLADECGLGKTVQAIEIVCARRSRNWRALVVCSKVLREQWYDAIREQDPDNIVEIVGAQDPIPLRSQWFITHYEAVSRNTQLFQRVWDAIIVDEAHRIANRQTIRSKAIKRLLAVRKIALTGTPMEKNPANLWSILNWLYPDIYTSYWAFFNKFVLSEEDYMGYRHILGPNPDTLPQLTQLLSKCMLRRTKQEVAPELPPRIIQKVPLKMLPKQHALYHKFKAEANKDIVVDLSELAGHPVPTQVVPSILSLITRLQQISSDPVMIGPEWDNALSSKLEWVIEWLVDNPTTPVVIFTRFRETAIHLHDMLVSDPSDLLIGGSSPPVDFYAGRVRVLIGTISMMGEGLNLQRADVAIFVDQEWSTIKMQQAIDRVHRMGITNTKLIYLLHNRGTVDTLVLEALESKWSDAELVYEFLNRYRV